MARRPPDRPLDNVRPINAEAALCLAHEEFAAALFEAIRENPHAGKPRVVMVVLTARRRHRIVFHMAEYGDGRAFDAAAWFVHTIKTRRLLRRGERLTVKCLELDLG